MRATSTSTDPQGMPSRPCVFLDRDGTLIASPQEERYVTRPEQVTLLPGVGAALTRLRQSGFLLVVVTNQRWIGHTPNGHQKYRAVQVELERQLEQFAVQLDATYVCPHEADTCSCRKPQPGLITTALTELPIDPARSVMVGDHPRDAEAGRRAGLRTITIGNRALPEHGLTVPSILHVVDLLEREALCERT